MSDSAREDVERLVEQAKDDPAGAAKEAKGKTKEKLGWATGDRDVEAEGRAEQPQSPVESKHEAMEDVRRDHKERP
jgi:uncharacterized protein YjbJ (UPF0337 family)